MDTKQKSRPEAQKKKKASAQNGANQRSVPQKTDAPRARRSAPEQKVRVSRSTQGEQRMPAGNRQRPAPQKKPAEPKLSREEQARRKVERERRAKQNREAIRARQRQQERAIKRREEAKRPRPAIVYTQPAVFNRSRLLMQLLIVTAVVLAVVMGLSIFFKVETITVSGANAYSEWVIREASGINEGDRLMGFSIPRASGRIMAELPYVDSVRIGIKLPDTVNIIVKEIDVVYAVQSTDGLWWLVTSGGKVVEQTDGGTAANYTKILGVSLEAPLIGEQATAFEAPTTEPTAETDASGALIGTTPVVVTNAERLSVALEILRALEANNIVGEAASVDVTDLTEIELWYGQEYQVKLGDDSEIDRKIASMYAAINSEKLKTGLGVLDVSFTIWSDKVMYTPFE